MRHLAVMTLIAGAALLLPACAQPPKQSVPELDREPAPETPDRPVHLSGAAVREIMQTKLAHAHSLLEAITLARFEAVEHHADELTTLSWRSEWKVHTTMAYGVFSDQFRQVTTEMAEHARRQDLDAVSADYIQMTASCLKCHSYLRREGLIRDPAGVLSRR